MEIPFGTRGNVRRYDAKRHADPICASAARYNMSMGHSRHCDRRG